MGDAPPAVAVATVERRAALRWKRYMDPEWDSEYTGIYIYPRRPLDGAGPLGLGLGSSVAPPLALWAHPRGACRRVAVVGSGADPTAPPMVHSGTRHCPWGAELASRTPLVDGARARLYMCIYSLELASSPGPGRRPTRIAACACACRPIYRDPASARRARSNIEFEHIYIDIAR